MEPLILAIQQKSWLIYRYSIVALYFWFAAQQLLDPGTWVGYLPEWTGYFPIPGEMLVRLHAWTELTLASMLLIGLYTRPVATLLALHLLFLAVDFGGAIGVRDAVLGVSVLLLAAQPEDEYTLDFALKEK
jgi:uncharacterized membrane protein YphA (DoxX/SURF4 family)